MKRAILFCSICILIFLLLDQVTKANLNWFIPLSNSFVTFDSYGNLGFVLGRRGALTIELIIATQVLVLSFLLPLYVFFINFIPRNSYTLYCTTSLVIAGCIGNVIDKIQFGFVRDFMNITFLEVSLNFADIFIILGLLLTLMKCLYHRKELFLNTRRKMFLIMPSYQLKTYGYVFGGVIFSAALFLIVSYFFIVFMVLELDSYSMFKVGDFFYLLFKLVFMIVINLLLMSFFVVGKLTHRSAGPIYAFNRFMNSLEDGNASDLKLRKNDNFKVLEGMAIRVRKLKD